MLFEYVTTCEKSATRSFSSHNVFSYKVHGGVARSRVNIRVLGRTRARIPRNLKLHNPLVKYTREHTHTQPRRAEHASVCYAFPQGLPQTPCTTQAPFNSTPAPSFWAASGLAPHLPQFAMGCIGCIAGCCMPYCMPYCCMSAGEKGAITRRRGEGADGAGRGWHRLEAALCLIWRWRGVLEGELADGSPCGGRHCT